MGRNWVFEIGEVPASAKAGFASENSCLVREFECNWRAKKTCSGLLPDQFSHFLVLFWFGESTVAEIDRRWHNGRL